MTDAKYCILVADDDQQIRQMLCLLLRGDGYNVLTAADGREAVDLASDRVDLYLLDVGMPRLSGILAAAEIRKSYDAPIVFLTAYSGESDKVMGFSVGADDYIVKPFSNAELLMRIRAILRRSVGASSRAVKANQLPIADALLDLDRQVVLVGEREVSLTYTGYKILELLAKNKKRIFSLDQIYEAIWDDNVVGNDAIMVHIKNIRKKLGDNSREPVYIKTAWGRGYYID